MKVTTPPPVKDSYSERKEDSKLTALIASNSNGRVELGTHSPPSELLPDAKNGSG